MKDDDARSAILARRARFVAAAIAATGLAAACEGSKPPETPPTIDVHGTPVFPDASTDAAPVPEIGWEADGQAPAAPEGGVVAEPEPPPEEPPMVCLSIAPAPCLKIAPPARDAGAGPPRVCLSVLPPSPPQPCLVPPPPRRP